MQHKTLFYLPYKVSWVLYRSSCFGFSSWDVSCVAKVDNHCLGLEVVQNLFPFPIASA